MAKTDGLELDFWETVLRWLSLWNAHRKRFELSLPERLISMSVKNSKKKSGTDWEYLASKSNKGIDYSDIPKLGPDFWRKATIRMPGNKQSITLRIDGDVLSWFKNLGRGYQTQINAVLRSYVDAIKKTS